MSKVKLYPHNQEAYKKIEQSIANGDNKIAISHATGTGKSYLIAKLCEDYNKDKKLVLVPSIPIKEDMLTLLEESDIENVEVKLYQSFIKMSDEHISTMNYKIVALDEYHHDTAEVWGHKVRTLIDSHPETIFFGTSATPVRTDGVNVIDELFDGNCVSNISLPQAIAKGIVPCPKYVAAFYTLDERLNELRRKIEKSTNSKEEKNEFYNKINTMRSQIEKAYGMPIILNNNIKDEEGRYIVFCKNKTHLEEIKDTVIGWFKTAGFKDINSYVVYSSYKNKDEEYEEFCNDTSHSLKLLFCINMLNEGSHKTNISGALLLRKTNSYIILLQQIGRTIESRKTNNPIIIDAVNNFIYVKDGIKLLTEIKEAIDEEKKTNKNFDESKFIDIDTFFITEYVCDIEKLLNEIEEKLRGNWDLYIKALQQYKDREGNCLIKGTHIEIVEGISVSLGNWVKNIRSANNGIGANRLTEEMKSELNMLGFIWNVPEYIFKDNIQKIFDYYSKYNKYPPTHSKDLEIKKLGNFIGAERTSAKNGNYPDWKVKILDRYHLNDILISPYEKAFNEFIYYLEKYKKEYGNVNIPQKCIIDGYNLGMAISNLKYKKNMGKLSNSKIKRLEEYGVYLCNKDDEKFNEKIELSKQAICDGVIINKKNQEYKGVNLDSWISQSVKRRYKSSLLSREQIEVIEKLVGKSLKQRFNNGNLVKITDIVENKDVAICDSYRKVALVLK